MQQTTMKHHLRGSEISYSGEVAGGIQLQGDFMFYPVGSAVMMKSSTDSVLLGSEEAKVSAELR